MKKIFLVLILSSMALLLSVSSQAQVKTIDLSKLELLNKIVIPGHAINAFYEVFGKNINTQVRFSPNGNGMVSLDRTGRLIWWEVSTGNQLESWRVWRAWGDTTFMLAGFQNRNSVCLLEQTSNKIKQFNLETGKMLDGCNNTSQSPDSREAYSPDGKYYLEIERLTYPVLYDAKTKKLIRRFGHSVTDFDLTANGETVFTGSQAGTIRTWNMKTGKEISRFEGDSKGIEKLIFSPKGNVIATRAKDASEVRLWNSSGAEIRRIPLPSLAQLGRKNSQNYSGNLRFSVDGQVLAVEFPDYVQSELRLYRTRDGTSIPLPLVNQNSSLIFTNHSDVLIQEEKLEQTISSNTQTRSRLSLIRIADGNVVWVGNWRDRNSEIVFSPDGTVFARRLEVFDYAPRQLYDVGISSINSRTGEGFGWFRIKDAGIGERAWLRLNAIAPGNRVLLLEAFTNGGDVSQSSGGLRMFDLQTKSEFKLPAALGNSYIRTIVATEGGNPPQFKFSPDGRYLMVFIDNRIDVWGTRDNRAIFKGQ